MFRITLLIGNGFDLAMGLETSYRSFLDSFINEQDNVDGLRWLQDEIKKDEFKNWSDVECAFASLDFSSNLDGNVEIKFDKLYKKLKESFVSYLLNQNKRLNTLVKKDEYRKEFIRRILHFNKHLTGRYAKEYYNIVSKNDIELSFVTFNYTDTLEWLLDDWCDKEVVQSLPFGNGTIRVKIGEIIHLHGRLKDRSIVFGVDNQDQISDSKIRAHCIDRAYLIKPNVDRSTGRDIEESARQLLSSSGIIMSYGLSYGKTDLEWWQLLYKLVFVSRTARLALCPYFDKANEELIVEDTDKIRLPIIHVFDSMSGQLKDTFGAQLDRTFVAIDGGIDGGSNCDYLALGWIGEQAGLK